MFDSDDLKAILDTDLEKNDEIEAIIKEAKLDDKAAAAVKAALKALQAYSDVPSIKSVTAKLMAMTGNGFPPPPPPSEEDKPEKTQKSAKQDPVTKSMQGLSEEDRKRIEKQFEADRQERERLQKQINEQNEKMTVRDYLEKAAPYKVPHFPADKLGPMMRAIDDTFGKDSDEAKSFGALCKSVSESEAMNELLGERGSAGSGTTSSPEDKLNAIAKSKVEESRKNGKPISFAKAYDEAMDENPELYREYDNAR